MLIGKFKTNQPFLFAVLLLIAVFLWIDAFLTFNSVSLIEENAAPLYIWIAVFFNEYRFWSVLLSFIFMIIQAIMFNRVIAGRNLVDLNSQLPALFYIVLMSNNFSLMGLHPIWFANFFLIIALDKIFDVFSEEEVYVEIFNVGFLISLASLFYIPALWFILLLISALIIYYLVNIRSILASIIGFVTPYMFVALYYYWFDKLEERSAELLNFRSLLSDFSLSFTPLAWASIGVIGIIALVAIFRIYIGGLSDKPVRIRKRYHVLLAYFIIAAITVPFAGEMMHVHQGLLMLPLAAIMAGFFQESKKTFWNELFFTLLIFLIIVGKLTRLE